MTEQEYTDEVLRTYSGPREMGAMLTLGALGLAGESGEVVDHIKKVLYQGHALDYDQMYRELGDVLWYFVLLCTVMEVGIEAIMQGNVEKLRQRYPDGFTTERSMHRFT